MAANSRLCTTGYKSHRITPGIRIPVSLRGFWSFQLPLFYYYFVALFCCRSYSVEHSVVALVAKQRTRAFLNQCEAAHPHLKIHAKQCTRIFFNQ